MTPVDHGRIRYIELRDSSGKLLCGTFRDCTMPRIDNQFLECSAYVYHNEHHANKGLKTGGSGFLVRVKSERFPKELWHLYAVTCKHVIEDGGQVVRLNKKDGWAKPIPLTKQDWTCSRKHDLAIAMLVGPLDDFKFRSIPTQFFITDEIIADEKIGPGDETFIVGRFIDHEGRQKNLPSVRCGTIAMMADKDEPIQEKRGERAARTRAEEAFLVEEHSKDGFSGSPVFVQARNPIADHYRGQLRSLEDGPSEGLGPFLLGVHLGQLLQFSEKAPGTNKKAPIYEEKETGMGIVLPAWHLWELLSEPRVKQKRCEADEHYAERQSLPTVKFESLGESGGEPSLRTGIPPNRTPPRSGRKRGAGPSGKQ